MSENTKINLDALMKRSSSDQDIKKADIVDVNTSTTEDISLEKNVENTPLGTSSENQTISTASPEITPEKIEEKLPSISINLDGVSEPEKTSKETEASEKIESPLKISESAPKLEQEPQNKHSISLAGLKSRNKKEETEETAEILENLQEVNTQVANSSNENEIVQNEEEGKELFGNYESKFTNQSSEILKRLRMPKTRIGMLFSLALVCVVVIGSLMYIDPKTHSISNYKTSVKSIYNDIKKGETSDTQTPTTETNPLQEEINRKNPVEDKASEEVIVVDQTPEEKANKKEEIKKENLKNFLIENYK